MKQNLEYIGINELLEMYFETNGEIIGEFVPENEWMSEKLTKQLNETQENSIIQTLIDVMDAINSSIND